MKTKKLLTAFVLLMVALIAGCVKDDFAEIVGVCPEVESTSPVDKATGVSLSKVITVTFNEQMNPATIKATSFTIHGLSPVAGTITYNDRTASFTPTNPLIANITYTGRITTTVKDMMGNAIQEDYVWTFSTDATPAVTLTSPFNNEAGVLLNKVITAQFNMAMLPSTLNGTTFTLKNGTTPVLGTVSYNGTNLSFAPTVNLLSETEYTATITTGAKSLAGIPMAANYEWKFSTGQVPAVLSTDPLNNAISVPLDKIISARFNMTMDPLSLMGTTFSIKQGTTPVYGSVTYNGTDLFFIPSGNLLPSTEYTATINTTAKSPTGIPMAADYVWKFTTLSTTAPTVTSTSPFNLETAVIVKKIVTAKFSMLMDPLTLNGSTFTLYRGTTPVVGTITYNGDDLSFVPFGDLLPGTEYTATITTGAKNLAGIALAANYIWKFTTVAPLAPTIISTNPINLTTGVVLNKVVTATFSVPMDPTTIIGANYTLQIGTTPVTGVVTYANSVAYFTPSSDLLPNTEYTVTVTTGVKNVPGTAMLNNYVWKFTTRAAAAAEPLFSSIFGSFGGNAGITNQGIYTVINNGSIGTTAASTLVTGFHDSTGDIYTETPLNIGDVKGRIYTDAPPPVIFEAGGPYGGNAVTMAIAQEGLLAARNFYNSISPASKPGGITLDNDELGGRTLAPGIYTSGSSYNISLVDLTLDAQGDANAVWIFQVPTALTVGTPSGARSVLLINGALAKNVYWYVGTAAVINYAGGGIMVGTIIANSGVTLSSPGNSTNTTVQTVLNGRAISLVSAVTMVNTIINVPE
ncbi:MAG: hypothetical protein ACD_77C00407G0008 [uncultured bacterium]|nr:MAG: hypothetical protein ACD_77C00407G0008 [uncultured bacterium]HBY01382.1 hypothetical protein [Rikenellaceae bacterium]